MGAPDRRAWLKLAGMAALGAGAACAARRTPVGATRRLAAPHLTPGRVVRTAVGLRPYRPAGFVVGSERLGDKTIVHHYGHGGAGITLSWGTAALALEGAAVTGEKRAAIIGAGAVGLATAISFQRAGWSVSIHARELPPATTSNLAAALWSPFAVYDPAFAPEGFEARHAHACRIAHRAFQDLAGPRFGIRWIESYELGDAPIADRGPRAAQSPVRDLFPGLRDLAASESPFTFAHTRRFFTMLVEPATYLRSLLDEAVARGATVEVRAFASPAEILTLPEPVIVNCTGLGSKTLFGDEGLVPMQGQIAILLPEPEVDYVTLCGDFTMVPRSDGIVLGGTYRLGDAALTVDPEATRRIMTGNAGVADRLRRF